MLSTGRNEHCYNTMSPLELTTALNEFQTYLFSLLFKNLSANLFYNTIQKPLYLISRFSTRKESKITLPGVAQLTVRFLIQNCANERVREIVPRLKAFRIVLRFQRRSFRRVFVKFIMPDDFSTTVVELRFFRSLAACMAHKAY